MPLDRLALSRATLDRAGHLRTDPALLDRLWAGDSTRVLRVGHGRVPVVEGEHGPRLELVSPEQAGAPRPDAVRIYLGRAADGVDHVAVAAEPQEDWLGLRQLGAVLDDTDAGLMTEAVALVAWHAAHTHCPRCGTPTEVVEAGWSRRCPADGSSHYPRTDPAVIMAVTDDAGRILLGHNPAWPAGRFSTLAGFVEPGESLEAAVRREVHEEVGVEVTDVTYLGSQPWPFPASLMLGFTARAVGTEVRLDDLEITDARWFSRAELPAAVAADEVLLPSRLSIARRIIEHWYGGELDDGTLAWR